MSATTTIIGYAAKDAMVTNVNGGKVVKISIPDNQKRGSNETTDWYNVSVFGKTADYAERIKKGDYVVAIGRSSIFQGERGVSVQVNANSISYTRPAPREQTAAPRQQQQNRRPPQQQQYNDEDVPW